MSPVAANAYPPAVLRERSEVLSRFESMEIPHAHGVVVDKAGTVSHEQGINISENGISATLYVADTTLFEPGGATDQHGLVRRSSAYHEKDTSSARHQRLFQDPIIYRRLDVTNPEGCPTIGVSFEKTDDGTWQVSGLDRARFFATEVMDAGSDEVAIELSETEHALEMALGSWLEQMSQESHIGFVHDERGRAWAHRPLRVWADFKNLQIVTNLLIDSDSHSVLETAALEQIEQHLRSASHPIRTVEQAAAVLSLKATTESQLVDMLALAEPSKYKLSREAFTSFCDAVLEGKVDPQKIVAIGRMLGSVSTRECADGRTVVTAGGNEYTVHDWEEFLITLLQRTDREDNAKSIRNRSILGELKRRQEMVTDNHYLHRALGELNGWWGRYSSGNVASMKKR